MFTSTVTAANGQVPASGVFIADPVGTYQWQAAYSGDAKNKPAASLCGSEPLTITAAPQLVPLIDMLPGQTYYGFGGGLYENGSNTTPADHETDGLSRGKRDFAPRDQRNSKPQRQSRPAQHRRIRAIAGVVRHSVSLLVEHQSVLYDVRRREPRREPLIAPDRQRRGNRPRRRRLDEPGKASYNQIRDHRLAPAGLTQAQVQIVWVEEADPYPTVSLPSPQADAYTLESYLGRHCPSRQGPVPERQGDLLLLAHLRRLCDHSPESGALRVRVGLRGQMARPGADQPDANRRRRPHRR